MQCFKIIKHEAQTASVIPGIFLGGEIPPKITYNSSPAAAKLYALNLFYRPGQ